MSAAFETHHPKGSAKAGHNDEWAGGSAIEALAEYPACSALGPPLTQELTERPRRSSMPDIKDSLKDLVPISREKMKLLSGMVTADSDGTTEIGLLGDRLVRAINGQLTDGHPTADHPFSVILSDPDDNSKIRAFSIAMDKDWNLRDGLSVIGELERFIFSWKRGGVKNLAAGCAASTLNKSYEIAPKTTTLGVAIGYVILHPLFKLFE